MRKHSTLDNRKAINWAEAVQQAEEEVLMVDDEVEAALEVELDAPGSQGGSGAVSIKRADTFEYGSVGSGSGAACGRVSPVNPGSANMRQAVASHGLAGARRQVGNGVEAGRARAAGIIRTLGNAKRG